MGSNYSSNLKKLTVKQNNCVRSIFFVNNRQSASPPYYQLLEILKFENIVKLKTAILTQKVLVNSSSVPSLFHNFLMPVKNIHSYNTRHAARCFYRPEIRTNFGKFTFKFSATVLWENITVSVKKLPTTSNFKRQYKVDLLSNEINNP